MPCGYDPEAIGQLLNGLIASDSACVLIEADGCVGGLLSPAYCDPKWVMAVELFWWAGGSGLRLLRGFEEWAIAAGAQEVRMTSLAALDRADRLLKRKGYAPCEISYTKVI